MVIHAHTHRKLAMDTVYEQQFRRSNEGAKFDGEEKKTGEESSWRSLVRPALIPPLTMVFATHHAGIESRCKEKTRALIMGPGEISKCRAGVIFVSQKHDTPGEQSTN